MGSGSASAGEASLRFELPGGGRALFTTRAEGNLSTLRGPGHERGRRERDRLRGELGLRWLCASRQVHGVVVQRVLERDGGGGQPALAETGIRAEGACLPASVDADGHATALRGVGVMVLVADCLPVLLGSEGAVAALHAGWRGLSEGVLEEGVRALRELGGGGEIAAVIGPGAGPCCYEVGEEVHAAFASGSEVGRHRRGRIDLPGLARERLQAAGVARIEDVGVCTICDARLFSHRREGLAAGRQAGVAWLS
jgi:YfiH family protein